MTVHDRLKKVRESLGKTQKDVARALGVSPRTWQDYEGGINLPGGKVLEQLARMGFNVNWILTGEGEIQQESRRVLPSAILLQNLAIKIRSVRGDDKLDDFAKRLDITKEEAIALENGEIEPGYGFLSLLCFEYDINPDWLFDESDIKTRKSGKNIERHINKSYFKGALIAASKARESSLESGLEFPPDLWVNFVVSAYDYAINNYLDWKNVDIEKIPYIPDITLKKDNG